MQKRSDETGHFIKHQETLGTGTIFFLMLLLKDSGQTDEEETEQSV